MTDPLSLDGRTLTPAGVAAVARDDRPVTVADAARDRVRTARERVESIVESGEAVYGLNTGFGELVDQRIPPDRIEDLQTNLVRSHAAATGEELPREAVRAMMVTRINALLLGKSGVRETVVDHLATMLNEGVHPVVPETGSLGASGDLAPLAHVALVLIGEGEARVDPGDGTTAGTDDSDRTPERLPGDEALATAGLDPLTLQPKEGLALINGTQLTVGLAALAVIDGERAVRAADVTGALTTEVTMGTTASCDPAIHDSRPHEGQRESAANVRAVAGDSGVVESHRNCDRVQDAYSIRCLPQVHGAVRDALAHLREAVETELNAATDNPLIFGADEVIDSTRASGTAETAVISGGNFHGAPLAHRLDYAQAALTDLASICERRVDRILNPNTQEPHLPPFLAADSGVESGLMIPQYTAAALVNELRSQGRTATDSTPVSGDQEDHVSMSATGAKELRDAVDRATRVVGIELLCAGEALEYVDDHISPGTGTAAAYEALRTVVDPLDGDRPPAPDLDRAATLVASGTLEERVRAAIDGELR